MFKKAPRLPALALSTRKTHLYGEIKPQAFDSEIIIGINICNQGSLLPLALKSALAQTILLRKKATIVILDDNSTDSWEDISQELIAHPRVIVIKSICGSAARARNCLLDYIDSNFPNGQWVARLDADDVLANSDSVEALCQAGDALGALYAIGSNYLSINGIQIPRQNIANPTILSDSRLLLAFIESFCLYQAQQELPSCNLLLRCQSGIRYPDILSAEDHWLVATLLFFRRSEGAIVPYPVYSTYSLVGIQTNTNKHNNEWSTQRHRLAEAARRWVAALETGKKILGHGLEGIVSLDNGTVQKQFYPWAIDAAKMEEIRLKLMHVSKEVAPPQTWWIGKDGDVRCKYPWFPSIEIKNKIDANAIKKFMIECYRSGVVVSNIKRQNLRITSTGYIQNIDIGQDIVNFTVSRFLDSAARLYSIGVLRQSDHELVRRVTNQPQHETLSELSGFPEFYQSLLEEIYPHIKNNKIESFNDRKDYETTLLIKVCAQDADELNSQVRHIVGQLTYPARFHTVILSIDSFTGPFLRQYSSGSLTMLLEVANCLKTDGIVDEIWIAPVDHDTIRSVYQHWFGTNDIVETHTTGHAPLHAQLWAFDQIQTQYVLQCDADVMIGRYDFCHDYLNDMKSAMRPDDVISVGFNIPQADPGFNAYQAEPGRFVPEVRLGLLNLKRIKALLPILNPVNEGKFDWMWHRALENYQQKTGLRSVRGGDSRSFYIHPRNEDKLRVDLPKLRDLISQGSIPKDQLNRFDLVADASWNYTLRNETIVFLIKGKDTSHSKLKRCFDSLARQVEKNFGLIVIDDGGDIQNNRFIPILLGDMYNRTTLIRREKRLGYIHNIIEAVEQLCQNPDTLIIILDQDDALMSKNVTARLMKVVMDGVDFLNGAMFRPNKPTNLYLADYNNPRKNGGGNTWAHMGGFRKSLFEKIPKSYFQINNVWVDDVTDFAIMLPMSELAEKPLFIEDMYCYFHERKDYSEERKTMQYKILEKIFSYPSLIKHTTINSTSDY